MYPVLFKIGAVTVYSLGLLWALGALGALWTLRLAGFQGWLGEELV